MIPKPRHALLTILSAFSLLFNGVAPISAAYYSGPQFSEAEITPRSPHPTVTGAVPDSDFDGLANETEVNGWFNDYGGPYHTDPNNPDSDSDGLSDGEEQLFDTDPTDAKHPGMFVEYSDNLHTAKYFVWQKHGSKYLARAAGANEVDYQDKDGLIVRRGAEFFVHGPPDAALTIEKSLDTLTTLTAEKRACGSGWRVQVPANSRVGIYTLKMERNDWSTPVTMPLYVIFEIPEVVENQAAYLSLSEAAIATALYNDDPNDIRDENVIWWGASDNKAGTLSRARSIAFPTDQYKAYIFEGHVIPTINGFSNQTDAAKALLDHVDAVTRFNPSKNLYSMKAALNSPQQRNQCSNIANVTAGFMRSAGIPSRGMNVDWDGTVVGSGVFDHATQIWLSNQWKTGRGYNVSSRGNEFDPELGGESCEVDGVLSIQCGVVNPRPVDIWGPNKHPEKIADIIYTAPDDWQWSTTGDEAARDSIYGYGFDYIWTKTPSDSIGIPSYGQFNTGSVETWTRWYWGWPSEPAITGPAQDPPWDGCPGYPCNEDGQGDGSGDSKGSATDTDAPLTSLSDLHSDLVGLGEIQSSYGVDADGNGHFDRLVVEVGLTVNQPGDYTIGASLDSPTFTTDNKLGTIAAAVVSGYFEAGAQVIKFSFDGPAIAEQESEGPYVLTDAWIAVTPSNDEASELAFSVISQKAEVGYVSYQSPAGGQIGAASTQSSDDFDNWGAALSSLYNHNAQDVNQDGLFDRLIVETTLDISQPGQYRLEAELADASGETATAASWTGSGPDVSLVFDTLLADTRPYQLKNVYLYNAEGEIIDIRFDGLQDADAYLIPPLYNTGLSAQATAYETQVSGATPVDSDNDGDFDRLEFSVQTNIPVTGNYRLEGWLESSSGGLISWQTGSVKYLGQGLQTLTLSFDGQTINAFSANGPYKLTALKVSWVFNNSYTPVDEVDEAYETSALTFADFDGVYAGDIFIDRMENGAGKLWDLANTTWGLTTEAAVSPIHAWTDSPNSQYNGQDTQLTTNALPADYGVAPLLSFQSCYEINQDGDQGEVQISINGGNWTTFDNAIYTGDSTGWTFEQLTGSLVTDANANVAFRFLMNSNDANHADGWYIDDVAITFDNDMDDDGIANGIELGSNPNQPTDTDNDGLPDYLDVDSDDNGLPDAVEGLADTDGDNIPNFQDPDNDGDGLLDKDEGDGDLDGDNIPNYEDFDSDGDGLPDKIERDDDTDGDGVPDYKDTDSDNDGLPDQVEGNADPDNDDIPNYKDTDSDGDGILDQNEWSDGGNLPFCTNDGGLDTDGDQIPNCQDNDIDGDGLPNYIDQDSDGDGQNDGVEAGDPNNPNDTDGDGIPDHYDSDPEINEGPINSSTSIYLPLVIR